MREFIITRLNGEVYTVQVDDADYDRVIAAGPWCVIPRGSTFYVLRRIGHTTQRLHRFLLGDACAELVVDHIDGNGLNNQRVNLRVCTHAENMRNRRINRNNACGFKGVIWYKRSRRWRAQIKVGDETHRLGFFDTPEEAHAAYCEAAARLHGEFARFK